jgi:pyruvate,water dikinase
MPAAAAAIPDSSDTILELSRMTVSHTRPTSVTEREHHFFAVAGPERREEALTFLDLARLSWRLRDDDNILIGRLESQLIRAVKTGAERLRRAGRLRGAFRFSAERADRIAAALQDDTLAPIAWADPAPTDPVLISVRQRREPVSSLGNPQRLVLPRLPRA